MKVTIYKKNFNHIPGVPWYLGPGPPLASSWTPWPCQLPGPSRSGWSHTAPAQCRRSRQAASPPAPGTGPGTARPRSGASAGPQSPPPRRPADQSPGTQPAPIRGEHWGHVISSPPILAHLDPGGDIEEEVSLSCLWPAVDSGQLGSEEDKANHKHLATSLYLQSIHNNHYEHCICNYLTTHKKSLNVVPLHGHLAKSVSCWVGFPESYTCKVCCFKTKTYL